MLSSCGAWALRPFRTPLFLLLLALLGGAFAFSGVLEPQEARALASPLGCGSWEMVSTPDSRTHHYLHDVEAIAPNDIWAVGQYYDEGNYTPDTALAMHWDGSQWTVFPTPNTGKRGILHGVSAVSSNDVWAVGVQYTGGPYTPLAMHWDGTSWTQVPVPSRPGGEELNDVVALSSNEVWAVGANDGFHETVTMRWNGSAWSLVPSPNSGFSDDNVLESVTAVSPTDIWAVGYVYPKGGTPVTLTLHWNGSVWSLVPSPNPGNYSRSLHGVAAVSASDVWAVGSYSYNSGTTYLPLFLRWNGSQWSHVPGPDFPDYSILRDAVALSANEVWAVGTTAACNFCAFETLTMRWDGTAWSREASPNGFRDFNRLYGVAAAAPGDLWAVGTSDNYGFPYLANTITMRRVCAGGTPTPVPTASPTGAASSTPTRTHTAVATSTGTVVAKSTATPVSTGTSTPPATTTPTTCLITFSDVLPTDYFYEPVRYLYCAGAISGYADNTFRPYNNSTRGQLTKIVVLAFGIPLYTPPTPTFSDVPISNPFYQHVETAAREGLVAGYSDGTFRPYNNVTRGQLSKIVVEAAGWPLVNPPLPTFSDVPQGSAFYEYIETAYDRGIISGYVDGTFRPGNDATRGQIAKIVHSAVVAP